MNRILSFSTLRKFWQKYPDTEEALKSWYEFVEEVEWDTPGDVKKTFRNASILKKGRVVFNIRGNKYRIVTEINYRKKWVFVRFVGTHKEYDKINANEI